MLHRKSLRSLRNKCLCYSTKVNFFKGLSLEGTLSLLIGDWSLGTDTEAVNSTKAHWKLETIRRDIMPKHFMKETLLACE